MSDYCAMVHVGPMMKIVSGEAPWVRCEFVPLSDHTLAVRIAGDVDMSTGRSPGCGRRWRAPP